mgnify:CR=1 FL=1
MANNAIIQAAGAAYGPAKGEYDISGFVQGFAAIGKGLAIRDAKITKGKELAGSMSIDTDFEPLRKIFENKQQEIVATGKNVTQGIKELNDLRNTAKSTLPKIKEFLGKMQKEKFSNAANPMSANYIDAYLNGQLEGKIKYKDDEGNMQETSTWMLADESDKIMVVGMDGSYVSPEQLLNDLTSMVRIGDSDKADATTTTFLARTDFDFTKDGKGEKKWEKASGIYKDQMITEFKNDPNAFLSFALDREHTIDGKRTSFMDQYLTKFLSGDEKAELDKSIKEFALNQRPILSVEDVGTKTKSLLAREIMMNDENLEQDKNDYLDMITESQKPAPPSALPKIGTVFDTSINNVPNYNINRLLTLFKGGFGDDGKAELGDLNIFKKDMGGGKIQLMRANKTGDKDKDEVLGFTFDPSKQSEVDAMMPYIQRLLFGEASKAELYAIKNFQIYLKNNPEILQAKK